MSVIVSTNRVVPIEPSRLRVGITLTQVTPAETQHGTPESRALANSHVEAMPDAVYNLQMCDFGMMRNITTSATSAYNWTDLDRRMQWLKDRGVRHILLTCYSAPDWMTVVTAFNNYRILQEQYEQAYADLCVEVLERYTQAPWNMPIIGVQFWNELKGYGGHGGSWNMAAYTRAYNKWHTTIRSHAEFSSIKLGGPYMIVEQVEAGTTLITPRNLVSLDYWHLNKVGADALCLDRSISHMNTVTQADYLSRTHEFAHILQQLKLRYPSFSEYWLSELYILSALTAYESFDVDFQAACLASVLLHALKAGGTLALGWGLQNDGRFNKQGVQCGWLMDTRGASSAGAPSPYAAGDRTPIYDVFKLFHDYFAPGTQLYLAESSSPLVEVLASATMTLLINKSADPVDVIIDNQQLTLGRYEVRTVDRNDVGAYSWTLAPSGMVRQ